MRSYRQHWPIVNHFAGSTNDLPLDRISLAREGVSSGLSATLLPPLSCTSSKSFISFFIPGYHCLCCSCRGEAACLEIVQLARDLLAGLPDEELLGLEHRRVKLLEAEQPADGLELVEQPVFEAKVVRSKVSRAYVQLRVVSSC